MDFDTTKWLQDDLNIKHLCEADLSHFIYHPRHGALFRRFIKFLSESTLCGQKYPDVYVKEELLEVEGEIAAANEELKSIKKSINNYTRESENVERELIFLKEKNNYLNDVQDLQQVSIKALDDMAKRPNSKLEQINKVMEQPEYLSNNDLETIFEYREEDLRNSSKPSAFIDDELNSLVKKINRIHKTIEDKSLKISDKFNNTDTNFRLKKVVVPELESIKIPQFEDVISKEIDEDYESLRKTIRDSYIEVKKLFKQVKEMEDNHRVRELELKRDYEELVRTFFSG